MKTLNVVPKKMYSKTLQKSYSCFEQFNNFCNHYSGVLEKLGFKSAMEAWNANPVLDKPMPLYHLSKESEN